MKTNIHLWSYLAQFFLEWEMFQTKVVEKIKTHILRSITFFFKRIVPHMTMWWKNMGTVGQATDNNMAHAYCKLDT